MSNMNMPAAPATHQWQTESFLGVDSTNIASGVHHARAVECPNMIRESAGKVRKRTGFYETYSLFKYGQINGVHMYRHVDISTGKVVTAYCVHAGNYFLNLDGKLVTVLTNIANNARSTSCQLGDKLVILDGMNMWFAYKGNYQYVEVKKASEFDIYVPTVIIGRSPSGGGTVYEPVNLLTKARTESFLGKASTTKYQLSAKNIESVTSVKKMGTTDGEWIDLAETTGYTVDKAKGIITFKSAPGASPVTGMDNVKITYLTGDDNSNRITNCRFCTLYGVNGAKDRVFVSGNTMYPNRDYYSQLNDPTYFGDTWYCSIGSGDSRIVGYSNIGDQLATHLTGSKDGTNIVLRRGTVNEMTVTSGTTSMSGTESVSNSTSSTTPGSTASFRVSGTLQCDAAISPYAIAIVETEPLFAVNGDILAVTPSDVIGERYAQSRAYYLRGLLKNVDLTDAFAVGWNGYFVLAAGRVLYLLDSTQTAYERNAPYSTRQYEAYYWTGIDARVLFVDTDGSLCFGTPNGHICKFHQDYSELSHFHDETDRWLTPIYAIWRTPEIYGDYFYYRKDFRRISAMIGAAVRTGCRIWAYYQGEKELLRDYDGTARYFSYMHFRYSEHGYKVDRMPQKLLEKIKIKKVDSVSFLIENDRMNEPMALYALAAEYTQRL